jgi:hypothetical protein
MAENKPKTETADAKPADKADGVKDWEAAKADLQAEADKVAEQGYLGSVPDETPNENYSLQTGPDAPTPETTRVHPNKAARSGDSK